MIKEQMSRRNAMGLSAAGLLAATAGGVKVAAAEDQPLQSPAPTAVLHGSPMSIFNDLSYTENAFRPQIGVDCIGISDFTR